MGSRRRLPSQPRARGGPREERLGGWGVPLASAAPVSSALGLLLHQLCLPFRGLGLEALRTPAHGHKVVLGSAAIHRTTNSQEEQWLRALPQQWQLARNESSPLGRRL